MPISVVVADTKTHAKAIITWMRLDPNIWVPVQYGQNLKGNYFASAKIVRPISGVTFAHMVWLETDLLPFIEGRKWAVPQSWCPNDGPDAMPEEQGYASMWDRSGP